MRALFVCCGCEQGLPRNDKEEKEEREKIGCLIFRMVSVGGGGGHFGYTTC